MSTAEVREQKLIKSVCELRDWYRSQGMTERVTLFAEDFDFLKRRKKIRELPTGTWLDSEFEVMRGHRKRRPRKKRPSESLV